MFSYLQQPPGRFSKFSKPPSCFHSFYDLQAAFQDFHNHQAVFIASTTIKNNVRNYPRSMLRQPPSCFSKFHQAFFRASIGHKCFHNYKHFTSRPQKHLKDREKNTWLPAFNILSVHNKKLAFSYVLPILSSASIYQNATSWVHELKITRDCHR